MKNKNIKTIPFKCSPERLQKGQKDRLGLSLYLFAPSRAKRFFYAKEERSF
jgi:hypothetical protein